MSTSAPAMDAAYNIWVDALLNARQNQKPAALDSAISGITLAEAQTIQADHTARVLQVVGGEVIGLKLGACNDAALAMLGLDAPFSGPLLSALTYESGVVLKRSDFMVGVIEAEVAVRLARDISADDGPMSCDDLAEAIDLMCPAIEIADARFENPLAGPATAIISDLGLSGALVKGQAYADWRSLDLATLPAVLQQDGEIVREGYGGATFGHPLEALRRVFTQMQREGQNIAARTWVSTGNWTLPYIAPLEGGHIVADFGPLGTVSVGFE